VSGMLVLRVVYGLSFEELARTHGTSQAACLREALLVRPGNSAKSYNSRTRW